MHKGHEKGFQIMTAESRYPHSQRSNPFYRAICFAGLLVLALSIYQTAIGPLDSEWLMLALVTVCLVSRVDIKYLKTSSALTLSDTFIFVSVLLYGIPTSVVLAGVDAAMNSLLHKDKR